MNDGTCRSPPKRSMGERYTDALKSNPLKTKAATAFILSGISAVISKMQNNGWKIDADVLTTAFQMALMSCPPWSHYWYPILDMISKNPVIKTIIDQVFWRPLMIAYSFVLVNLFRGKSLLEIKNILKESFPTTVKNAWRIWPAAQLLNQLVVPLHLRTVSMDCVGFFWDMYLTLAITKSPPAIEPNEPSAPPSTSNEASNEAPPAPGPSPAAASEGQAQDL
mmetsp:Transcript_66009/g.113466  ORF Transcript_66009/g.113466 Transcript_66009/m.113466 type:complete len:222 (+) Transcript_66009:24-689(+)